MCTARGSNMCTKRGTNMCTARGSNMCTVRGFNMCTTRGSNMCTARGSKGCTSPEVPCYSMLKYTQQSGRMQSHFSPYGSSSGAQPAPEVLKTCLHKKAFAVGDKEFSKLDPSPGPEHIPEEKSIEGTEFNESTCVVSDSYLHRSYPHCRQALQSHATLHR